MWLLPQIHPDFFMETFLHRCDGDSCFLENFLSFSGTWNHFLYICSVVLQSASGRHIDKDAELAFIRGYRNLANSHYEAIMQWSRSILVDIVVK